MSPVSTLPESFLTDTVRIYLRIIEDDPLTVPNLSVVTELLQKIEKAGKMDELEAMLMRHGALGLQSPYNEIVNSCNVLLGESKSDKRCITVMRNRVEEVIIGVL